MIPLVSGIIEAISGFFKAIPFIKDWLEKRAERKAALSESKNRIEAIEAHAKRDEDIDAAIARELAAGRVSTAPDEKPTTRDNANGQR